jgi:hypothetical protein
MIFRLAGLALALVTLAPVAADAGAWTLDRGRFWGKVAYFQQSTDEWYINNRKFIGGQWVSSGQRQLYDFDGEYEFKGVFLEGTYGLSDRLDIGFQLPFVSQRFENSTQEGRTASGWSDLRLLAKLRLLSQPLVFSIKGGVKLPTGKFINEDGLIPVGQGQWDFDLSADISRSLWPLPLYTNIEIGYRIRTINKEVDLDPGDEWFFTGELGYQPFKRLFLVGKIEALRGKEGATFGFRNPSLVNRVTYLSPTLVYKLNNDTAVEIGQRHTINGKNFAAGWQLMLGLSTGFDAAGALQRLR